jgi:hypothetical protein
MILLAPSTAALATRKRDTAGRCRFHRSTFIGSDAGELGVTASQPTVPLDSQLPYPVAYLIELDAHSDLDVHFHRANQFQVFVAGDGSLGHHRIEAVTVHYAGAFTAYGPIRPGDRGLSFFTLRDAWDPGARFLPEHKDELRLARTPRREALGEPIAAPADGAFRAPDVPQSRQVLGPDGDARGAWLVELPPGAALTAPTTAGSGGQFWLMLAGTLVLSAAQRLPRWSCAYLDPVQAPPAAHAGDGGAQLLVLRLPARLTPGAGTTASDAAPSPAGCD